MGIWFSSPNKVIDEVPGAAVVPETSTLANGNQIIIRHRPTCLSTDLDIGFTDIQEKAISDDKKVQ